MKEYIKLNEIKKNKNKIEISFSTSEIIAKYFYSNIFFMEYDFDIENIPNSILIVPFLTNILPMVWLTNCQIEVDEVDKDFYESIDNFKKGYIKMYPNLKFNKTNLKFNKIITNKKTKNKNCAAFFSGGVDAYATLFSHLKEKPALITVWGADIETNNAIGWNKMKNITQSAAQQFNLKYEFTKSNFKEFLNTSELNKLIKNSNDKWWHGFQHGIGLIGLSAPIAYKLNLSNIYIASSYTKEDKVTCASHPTIDNNISFCNTKINHDLFELNRQQKISKIISISNKLKQYPKLHVCWENTSGKNCCKCEKCIRTMIGIMIANDNPSKYGFKYIQGQELKKRMIWYNNIDPILYPLWENMIKLYKETEQTNQFKNEINWLKDFNIYQKNNIIKKILRKVDHYFERKK